MHRRLLRVLSGGGEKGGNSQPPPGFTLHPDCSPRSSVSDSLYQIDLDEHYTIDRELGTGTYGRVVLAECRQTGSKVALKILKKSSTKLKDFLREFNYSYYLSPQRHIVNTYDVAFETTSSYVFAQEYAALGDLFEMITPQVGMPEHQAKRVAVQISEALEFMHSKELVHRDIKPENILIFDESFNKVKLMDFGMTKKSGTMVRKVSTGIPYTPPEICEMDKGDRYSVECAADTWALAALIYCTLTGSFPWELAHSKDIFYSEFLSWQKRKTSQIPTQWRRFTPRFLRLMRRMLDWRSEKRSPVGELRKFIEDDWLDAPLRDDSSEDEDGIDPMEELTTMLATHGIDTTVSRRSRQKRVSEWVMNT